MDEMGLDGWMGQVGGRMDGCSQQTSSDKNFVPYLPNMKQQKVGNENFQFENW